MENLWVTRNFAAASLGMSTVNLDQRIRPRMEKDGERGKGRTLRLHMGKLIEAYLSHRQELAGGGDPLLSGSDSPALERYRQARAETCEIELARIKGELLPADGVSRHAVKSILAAKGILLNLPARLSIECAMQDGPTLEKTATEIVYSALEELSNGYGRLVDTVVEEDRKQRNQK